MREAEVVIHNEQQYLVTKANAERFREGLRLIDQKIRLDGVATRLRQAERDGMQSVLDELERELSEYEATRR